MGEQHWRSTAAWVALVAAGCGTSGTSGAPGGSSSGPSASGSRASGASGSSAGSGTSGSSRASGSSQTSGTQGDAGADASTADGSTADASLADGSTATSDAGVERGGFCAPHWCWSLPLPQGNGVSALWSSPAGHIYEGTEAGLLLVWDGSVWKRVDLGTRARIWSVWGTSDANVWTTDGSNAFHFDGQRWAADPSPLFAQSPQLLQAISGTAANDVWMAAQIGLTGAPAFHYDGTQWTALPLPPSSVTAFSSVSAASSTSVYFGGATSDSPTPPMGLFQWDGAAWHQLTNTAFVDTVWATGPTDVWFYEAGGLNHSPGPTFADLAAIGTGEQNVGLDHDVAGTSDTDMWLPSSGPTVQHFTGTAWSQVPLEEPAGVVQGSATVASAGPGSAVVGSGLGRVWSVQGDAGVSLVPLTPANAWGYPVDLSAVWSDGATVFAGGAVLLKGTPGTAAPDVWTVVPWTGTETGIASLWGSSATDVWLAGTLLAHCDGATAQVVASGLPSGNPAQITWNGVAGSGPHDVWLVGTKGMVSHYDGTQWTASQAPTVGNLNGVWVSAAGEAWAVGQAGVVIHYVPGTGWSRADFGSNDWQSVWGTPGGDVWIGGDGLARRAAAATAFSQAIDTLDPAFFATVFAIRDDGHGGIVAVGENGNAIRWNGSAWAAEATLTNERLSGLWLDSTGAGWSVGASLAILRRRP